MSKQRVAIAGAGNLGVPMIKSLLQSGFRVTVLTRSDPSETAARLAKAGIPTDNNPDLNYAVVDYTSESSLTSALKDHFAVISTLGGANIKQQTTIIDAAIAAGVTRFLPSEFGSNTRHPAASGLAPFRPKVATAEYLAEKAAANPKFSYTALINGPFFDWGLSMGFLLNPKKRTAVIYDGGDVPFSTTTLDTIGKAIAKILSPEYLEQTKNRTVYIHDAVVTQNQIIALAKKNGSGDWDVTETTVAETKEKADAAIAKGDFSAAVDHVRTGIFGGEKYGADFSKFGTDNELLGLPLMGDKEIEQVVVAAM